MKYLNNCKPLNLITSSSSTDSVSEKGDLAGNIWGAPREHEDVIFPVYSGMPGIRAGENIVGGLCRIGELHPPPQVLIAWLASEGQIFSFFLVQCEWNFKLYHCLQGTAVTAAEKSRKDPNWCSGLTKLYFQRNKSRICLLWTAAKYVETLRAQIKISSFQYTLKIKKRHFNVVWKNHTVLTAELLWTMRMHYWKPKKVDFPMRDWKSSQNQNWAFFAENAFRNLFWNHCSINL